MDVNSFMLDVGERRDWDKEESWWLPSCPGGLHSLFAAAKSIKHLYFLFYLPPTESCYGANSLFNRRPIRSCPRSCQEINSQRSFSLFVKIHLVFTFFFLLLLFSCTIPCLFTQRQVVFISLHVLCSMFYQVNYLIYCWCISWWKKQINLYLSSFLFILMGRVNILL